MSDDREGEAFGCGLTTGILVAIFGYLIYHFLSKWW